MAILFKKICIISTFIIGTLYGSIVSAQLIQSINVPIIGLTVTNELVLFFTENPRNVRHFGQIAGLTSGDTRLVGIDFRPQDDQLYGLGDNGGLYRFQGLLSNNPTAIFIKTIADQFGQPILLEGGSFDVDFSPPANALRVISDTGQNLAVSVDPNGADAVAGRTNPVGITGIAYINSDDDPDSGSVLFDIRSNFNQMYVQAPPNNGALTLVSRIRGVNFNGDVGFDIFTRIDQSGRPVKNYGYAVINNANRGELYALDLTAGRAASVTRSNGLIRSSSRVFDIAIPTDCGPFLNRCLLKSR